MFTFKNYPFFGELIKVRLTIALLNYNFELGFKQRDEYLKCSTFFQNILIFLDNEQLDLEILTSFQKLAQCLLNIQEFLQLCIQELKGCYLRSYTKLYKVKDIKTFIGFSKRILRKKQYKLQDVMKKLNFTQNTISVKEFQQVINNLKEYKSQVRILHFKFKSFNFFQKFLQLQHSNFNFEKQIISNLNLKNEEILTIKLIY
ncbi:unnamed protein product [Paramecium sonneborni]|uniref:Uncharacterized protein n=1 Tax=Paramecium sonneborni TaxID=65129 RepID=A0A8S1KPH3_9CILI|nr:unnamed protein product [Paramecium sonneborni]